MPVHALVPRFLEKVWGSQHLAPWFPDTSLKIGEVWLEGPSSEPLALLIKFLFTTSRLSYRCTRMMNTRGGIINQTARLKCGTS